MKTKQVSVSSSAIAVFFAVLLGLCRNSIAVPPEKSPASGAVAPDAVWTMPLFGGGVKTSDRYTDGNVFLTLPLWSTLGRDGKLGGDYLFIEPYSSVGEGGEVAASLGLSYRHLFSHESVSALGKKGAASFMEEGWFVGGSLFLDMLDTQHRNTFWQIGVGAEVGNRYVELRGNYYIPMTGDRLAERNVSTQSFTSSSTRYLQSGGGYGDPYATGNQIAQDVNMTTSAVTTYRTTTIRTVTEIFEKGMQGWDAEMSVLVPWVDQWADVRLIGGYFSFDNQPFGPQSFGTGHVHGWKAGVEVRPVPALVFTGMWYEDRRLVGGNWLVGVQLQVPLDRTWKDAFTPRRRHLAEHLAEPVHRQNDAIKVGNTKEEHSTTSVSTRRVTRVVSQTQQHLVLADDVIFVNNGPAVGNGIQAGNPADTGTGTAENPTYTVQHGATIAGANNASTGRVWNVYTQGGGATSTYAESVTVKGSTNFISSFTSIAGQGGKVFGGNTVRPVIQGGFLAQNIPLVGITAYEVTGGLSTGVTSAHSGIASGQGIFFENVTNGAIRNNSIHNVSANGIYAESNGGLTSNLNTSGNTISNNGDHGMVAASFDTANATFTLDSNTFSGNSLYGFASSTSQTSTGNFNLTGNTITGNVGGIGVWTYAENTSTANVTMAGNTVTGQPGQGVYVKAVNGANFADVLVSGNTFTNIGIHGVRLETNDTSSMTATVSGNDFHTAGGDYIHDDSFGSSTLNLTAGNNTFHSAVGDAIRSRSYGTSTTTLIARDNVISDQLGNGISIHTIEGSLMNATLANNIITNASVYGIYSETTGNIAAPFPVTNLAITGNTITGPSGWGGIMIDAASTGATLNITALDSNTITGTGHSADGIFIRTQGGANTTITSLSGNTITNAAGNGLNLESVATSTVTANNISGNTITHAGANGIRLYTTVQGTINATLNANTITGSAQNAILSDSYHKPDISSPIAFSQAVTLIATNNIIGVADGWIGINMRNWNGSQSTLTATGNTITGGTGGFGMYLALFPNSAGGQPGLNYSFLTATVSGNTITGNNNFVGVASQANENTVLQGGINNNIITTGDNGQGILISTNVPPFFATLAIGGNTISVGNGTASGIHLDPNSVSGLKVNVGITPVDNTVTRGAGLFLNSTGGGTFGPGSVIKINGATYVLPASF